MTNNMRVCLLRRVKRRTSNIGPNIISLIKLNGLERMRKFLKLLKSFNRQRKMEEIFKRDSGGCSFKSSVLGLSIRKKLKIRLMTNSLIPKIFLEETS
jgi:hypothetical protein